MDVAACVTTRNEAATIGPLVRALRDLRYGVIVCDAASTDGTPRLAREAGAEVLALAERLPIAPALMLAWRCALEQGCLAVVQLDAGGAHDPKQAPRLVAALLDADMAIGTRFARGGRHRGNRRRALCSRLAAGAFRLAQSGAPWSDWTSGYRAWRAEALWPLLDVDYLGQMHAWQAEVLAHAGALRLRIAEVPITYTAGRSSLDWRAAWEAARVWTEILHHVRPAGAWRLT